MAQSNNEASSSKKKKRGALKYLLYIVIILVATTISLISSLYGKVDQVLSILSTAYIEWIFIFFGVICLSYLVEALIIKIFVRLYTRKYLLYRGMAVTMIGTFYNNVTPGASGGQVMQVYTLNKQGIQVSNAASIMVMWFILYQTTLVVIDIGTLIIEWDALINMSPLTLYSLQIPMIYIVFFGFGLNVFLIFMLFFMSYSHRFHNFILHHVIGFFGKIHILRNPDKTRENLRVQVENFKIELRRLQSNIPVVIVIMLLFVIMILMRDGFPYFSFMAIIGPIEGYSFNFPDYMTCAFLGSFHQMCAGIIPLPGQSGISEYFFIYIFRDFVGSILSNADPTLLDSVLNASQILWRTMTYHIVVLISGVISAFYRARPRTAEVVMANRQTFVDLQLTTMEERKKSADSLYETRQLSRKSIQNALLGKDVNDKKNENEGLEFSALEQPKPEVRRSSKNETVEANNVENKENFEKPELDLSTIKWGNKKKKGKKAKKDNEDWDSLTID